MTVLEEKSVETKCRGKRLKREGLRIGGLLVLATAIMFLSTPLAMLVGEPAFAPWGAFAGLAVYGVALSHLLRRLMFPYIDMEKIHDRANDTPTGSGLVFLGMSVILAAFLVLMSSLVRAEVPPNATKYLPVLKAEQSKYWADMSRIELLAAQVEQETCLRPTHRNCWSPMATNKNPKNKNELGIGLGQITKTSRMDALGDLLRDYPRELAGMTWNSVRIYDPAYQLRALVLKDHQNYRRISGTASENDRLAMMFAAYNGGTGGLISDRRICMATAGCNAGIWFGHVEHTSKKTKYGANGYSKGFFHINREYAHNIMRVRWHKYVEVL